MDLFLKITIAIVAILLVVLILFPCQEYFENAVDKLSGKSSVLYSDKTLTTDEAYFNSLNSIGNSNDLLTMYRCIEFKASKGIENVIDTLKNKNKFFISNKYEMDYTDFSTIEEKIKQIFLDDLGGRSNKILHGPIYLLITQYPVYTSVSYNCTTTTLSSPLENSYSPIVEIKKNKKCPDNTTKVIRCEFYILMPSHKSNRVHNTEATWSTIKENMKDLLVSNKNIINVRSQDKPCFTKCGEIQVDGYSCAARNGRNSVVFNTPKNNTMQKTNSDYANLYIINTNGINRLLGTTVEFFQTQFIKDDIEPQPIEIIDPIEEPSILIEPSKTNDNANVNPYLDLEAYEARQALEYMSDLQAKCYIMRYSDVRQASGDNIQTAKNHWIQYGIAENRIKECDQNQLNIINATTSGLTAATAAPSAKHILDTYNTTQNGVYWIDLPVVGPTKVYCIMDPNCAGGGWMLAMKGGRSSTFHYNSGHWSRNTTLNRANPSVSEGDAKYNVFNYYPARDWFAGFPDVPTYTGDVSRDIYNGFTWVEHNAANADTTLLRIFRRNIRITKSRNPHSLAKFNPSVWSSQSGFQFYGINYRDTRRNGYKSRWGFGWNNESHERSNDVGGGIGTQSLSAGDRFGCCGQQGLNRPMRFEFYVR